MKWPLTMDSCNEQSWGLHECMAWDSLCQMGGSGNALPLLLFSGEGWKEVLPGHRHLSQKNRGPKLISCVLKPSFAWC